MAAAADDGESWPAVRRALLLPAYLPVALQMFAETIALPVVPLHVHSLGGSDAVVGAVVGAGLLGSLVVSPPAGLLVARVGVRGAMLRGLAIYMFASLVLACVSSLGAFVCARVLAGCGGCIAMVARQAYLAARVPGTMRGKAASLIGGVIAIAGAAGPAAGGVLYGRYGTAGAFGAQAAVHLANIVLVARAMPALPPRSGEGGSRQSAVRRWRRRAATCLRRRRGRALAAADAATALPPAEDCNGAAPAADVAERCAAPAAGAAPLQPAAGAPCVSERAVLLVRVLPVVFVLVTLRSMRNLLLPLKALSLGFDESSTGALVTVAYGMQAVLFPLAGLLMDRWGRKASAVPSLAITALSFLVLARARTTAAAYAAATLGGLSSGIVAGLVQALGADLAPPASRAQFLGKYKVVCDLGALVGSPAVGAISSWASLDAACVSVALVALSGAGWYLFLGVETLPGSGAGAGAGKGASGEHRARAALGTPLARLMRALRARARRRGRFAPLARTEGPSGAARTAHAPKPPHLGAGAGGSTLEDWGAVLATSSAAAALAAAADDGVVTELSPEEEAEEGEDCADEMASDESGDTSGGESDDADDGADGDAGPLAPVPAGMELAPVPAWVPQHPADDAA